MTLTSAGSSPLTRGKLPGFRPVSLPDGLIPAHAGKTVNPPLRRAEDVAHPRSRGENPTLPTQHQPNDGSSPLTRGKPWSVFLSYLLVGLIPAHAGKTHNATLTASSGTAHPRSRGENLVCVTALKACRGSSPLTRGKLAGSSSASRTSRLIPAHAGKTPYSGSPSQAHSAHPRSRGENTSTIIADVLEHGSSPLTRGKHTERVNDLLREGLIPAHAGKTRQEQVSS